MDEELKNQTAMMDKTSSQKEGRERELNLFKSDPAGTDEQTSRTGGAAMLTVKPCGWTQAGSSQKILKQEETESEGRMDEPLQLGRS